MSTQSTSRRRTVVALVAVGVLLASLAGAAVLVTRTPSDSSGSPTGSTSSPTLALSRTSNVGGAVAAAADGAPVGGGYGGYQLAGTLGTDSTDGVVIDPGGSKATAAQVTALLRALGMNSPEPKAVAGGWTASGTADGRKAAFALDERAGNVWEYRTGDEADCLSVRPGAAPDTAVSCAVGTASSTPKADAKGPGKAALLAAAKGVFSLVGVTPGAGLKANDAGGTTYLDVPLTVEGLPVVDVNLSVSADATGITSGFGWLSPTFSTVGEYPLISARAGFDLLKNQPVPALAQYCGPGKPCPTPTPQKVTAARLAWLTSRNGEDTVLVPAWQYEVDGFYGPAVVALPAKYLATPTPVAVDPGTPDNPATPGSPGTGGGSAPGASAEPGNPADAPTPVSPPTRTEPPAA